jgi:hypothetical protein
MVQVTIEVHSRTAFFTVLMSAQSIQHALSMAAARYPSSVTRVKFPIDPERFFLEDSAA